MRFLAPECVFCFMIDFPPKRRLNRYGSTLDKSHFQNMRSKVLTNLDLYVNEITGTCK